MTERSIQNIRLALRILSTLGEERPCDPADEVALRRVAWDLREPGMALDELACLVIHRERQACGVGCNAPILYPSMTPEENGRH